MNEREITNKMLEKLREHKYAQAKKAAQEFIREEKEDDNFLTKAKILMEEAVDSKKKVITEEEDLSQDHKKTFVIKKSTPQFGDVLESQVDGIRKTINDNVTFGDDALRYYPDANDITLDGKIPSLNLKFQFRYNDPSTGCYIWCEAMVLNDENARMVGKIRDAYVNWKNSITQDGDLMDKLNKASKKEDND
jgi:hypothetical protein